MILLRTFLRRFVQIGRLTVIDHRGEAHRFGGRTEGPVATIRLHDAKFAGELARNPRLKVGEGYMDGRLTIEEGTLLDFLRLAMANQTHYTRARSRPSVAIERLATLAAHHNPIGKAQENVAHHYDLSDELFDLFLDQDRQYSCAYFRDPSDTLEQAQEQKMRHIAAKLLLKPGQKVLDIGCGWGGLALYLARQADIEVTGLTLSVEQLSVAQRRAKEAGLSDRVTFKLLDYRLEPGQYDRIVSVGMFEHVGNLHYAEYFTKVRDLLVDDGVAMVHTIGSADVPSPVAAWVRKYIFPGGYLPSFSEIAPHLERLGIWLTDFESLRTHYAETLKAWNERFQAHRDHVRDNLYDERFCRMWEFYLQVCEASFRDSTLTVFQMQIAKDINAVPFTRDYLYEWEQEHAPQDQQSRPQLIAGE